MFPETQVWEYGFFEEFAIYKNDFWEYELLKMKGKKVELILKKGQERHAVKVILNTRADSLCTLKPLKEKVQSLRSIEERIPKYRWAKFLDYNIEMEHDLYLEKQKESYHARI